jgi:hypothetical protein
MGSRSTLEALALASRKPGAAAARRRFRRGREKRLKQMPPSGRSLTEALPAVVPAPDPVRIAVLAMESLGRASLRASFTGTEVRVTVPDAATAAIFEAAIAETTRSRSTDRLIRIVID